MDITIDPRDFIHTPFCHCPRCGEKSFGVLSIGGQQYVRRCRECRWTSSFPLPGLSKKVVYVDQMGISNMMKSLNPATRAHKQGNTSTVWRELFDRLDSLGKLQLIVCPDSEFHRNESLLSPFYPALKRLYDLLSQGVSFDHHHTIKEYQISQHAHYWIRGEVDKVLSFDTQAVVHGTINEWQDRLIITVDSHVSQDVLEEMRQERDTVHSQLADLFGEWQRDRPSFEQSFKSEYRGFGESVLKRYIDYTKDYYRLADGQVDLMEKVINPPLAFHLVRSVEEVFREAGVGENDLFARLSEYFRSSSLTNVPFLRISALLYAALARKAAAGQKRPPTRGMFNDIELISVLLPYCDAMFIDNECAGFFREAPLCTEIKYDTKVFSLNTIDGFFEYLDATKAGARDEHFAKVAEVYGDDWGKPYTSLYDQEHL